MINMMLIFTFTQMILLYCGAQQTTAKPLKQQASLKLQAAFDVIQSRLHSLKLVLNVDKTNHVIL